MGAEILTMNSENLRQPPANIAAEKAVLGAILVNNQAFDGLGDFLRPEHFVLDAHRRIYETTATLIGRGETVDTVTLKHRFDHDDTLAGIGGPAYLNDLAMSAVTVINAGEYARLIFGLARKRELVSAAQETIELCHSGGDLTAEDIAGELDTRISAMAVPDDMARSRRNIELVGTSALRRTEAARASKDGIIGLATGLVDVDKLLGGMAPANLYLLAGRPSMGKSALATTICRHVIQQQTPVQIFSLEMSSEEIAHRMAADMASVNHDLIRNGRLDDDEMREFRDAVTRIQTLPLHIDDTPALTAHQIMTRARQAKRKHGIGLVVVDHMQLVAAKAENRTQELTKISAAMKAMAKDCDVPVLALSQLSRAVEQRENKRPILSDLRESGSLEQDSDVVAFIYREHYYLERQRPQIGNNLPEAYRQKMDGWRADMEVVKNDAEVDIAKNRHGRTGRADLFFAGQFLRFGNKAKGEGFV